MGGIWVRRRDLLARTGDIVGYKSGLGLTREEFNDIIPKKYHSYWFGENSQIIRIRSEEFEEIIACSLYEVGNIESPSIAPVSTRLFHKYKNDKQLLNIFIQLMGEYNEFLKGRLQISKVLSSNSIDPTPFVIKSRENFGEIGEIMAIQLLEGQVADSHRSPWNTIRKIEWKNIAELRSLFNNESLETLYGRFLDQRYIDYLDKNFDSIGDINWRKFEGLTCEFFERQGYRVEIGEGRNDGGIDARVWKDGSNNDGPPTILIQCKRYKNKIEQMVVKSLWADMLEENAEIGLIVTTSSLTPGSEKLCLARKYPIEQADRKTLQEWVRVMRTPQKGIFLSE